MTTVPVLISFVPAGIGMTAAFLRSRGSVLLSRPPVLACICGLFFVAQARPVTPVRSYGFKQAAEYLTTKPELRDIPVLTSSNSIGEGLMIVELELRESRPRHYVIRASKLLADDDWAGLHYNARYQSAAEVDQALKEVGADVLAIDFTAGPRRQAHHQQLLTMIADPRSDWRLAGSFGPPDRNVRPVRIYLRRHRAGSTNKETIGKAMANILDRVLN